MAEYKFPCGCSWNIIEENPPEGVIPLLDFDVEKAPEDCKATWDLLGKGLTKGVFQLESNLGKAWTKRLKPDNLEHITALGSILRPGSLESKDENGVSMTMKYCLRKNGSEEITPYHPAVDPILSTSYGIMCFQEQILSIAQAVAGFTLEEADSLRKAIGKKLPEEMAKCKKMFVEGAEKAKVITKEMAEELFTQIEKSQRYLFNKSHACCYGITGYESAYIKAHFPLAFFTSWLYNAKNKQDPQQEIFELVSDAKIFDIEVEPPDLLSLEADFHSDRKTIKFGLSNIKGIGNAQIEKLTNIILEQETLLGKRLWDFSWWEFLIHCSSKITSSVVTRLIEVGALRWTGLPRQVMVSEFKVWESLTKKEQEWVVENSSSLKTITEALDQGAKPKKEGGACSNKNRVSILTSQSSLLKNPPSPVVDTPNWIAFIEKELLGISITCSKVDSCDMSQVNCTCKEYLAGRTGYLMFGVEIQTAREWKTKKGKSAGSKMGFLTISDGSCSLDDVVCFPDVWKESSQLLTEGNTVIIHGQRDNKKDSTTLIVNKVWQANQSLGM